MIAGGPRLIRRQAEGQRPPSCGNVVSKPRKRQKAVLELIRTARRSLLLSIFRCDDIEVLHALGEAAARGVRIEVLMTSRAKGWGKRLGPLAGVLERMGVIVHRFDRGGMKYHAKFIVADETKGLIGTINLTRKCFSHTQDFVLVTDEPELVAGLVAIFRTDAQGSSTARNWPERLIVGPDDSRARIESLLRSARHSIQIIDHKLDDPGILAVLRERRRQGVKVEIRADRLAASGTPHGRLIIVDRVAAVFGSLALSRQSLDARRELAVAIREPKLVAKLLRHFDVASPAAKEPVEEEAA